MISGFPSGVWPPSYTGNTDDSTTRMPLAHASCDIRSKISFDFFKRHRAGLSRDVIRPGKNHYDARLQCDYVRPKLDQHLRSGLPADSAANVRFAGEKLAESRLHPHIRNGIAHKDHARFVLRQRGEGGIGLSVAVLQSLFVVCEFLFQVRDLFRKWRCVWSGLAPGKRGVGK